MAGWKHFLLRVGVLYCCLASGFQVAAGERARLAQIDVRVDTANTVVLQASIDRYRQLLQDDPAAHETWERLVQLSLLQARYFAIGRSNQLAAVEQAVRYARYLRKSNPDSRSGMYWYGMALQSWIQVQGVQHALHLVPTLHSLLADCRATEFTTDFVAQGCGRIDAELSLVLPAFPVSSGDPAAGLEQLRQLQQLDPADPLRWVPVLRYALQRKDRALVDEASKGLASALSNPSPVPVADVVFAEKAYVPVRAEWASLLQRSQRWLSLHPAVE